jgi:FlaG/FlaF family flagellin (archaellin)
MAKARKISPAQRGVASVVTTVILVAGTLVITLAATLYAYTILESQTELTEYENGKLAMVGLAETIEGLLFTKGSAAYTTLYLRTSGLVMTSGTEYLSIGVNGATVLGPDIVDTPTLRAGRLVGSADYVVLRGDPLHPLLRASECLIVKSGSPQATPLGWVYTKQQDGAWVVVDFGRARVVFSGANNYTIDGYSWEALNVVEVTYVRIHYGPMGGRDLFDIRARVTNSTTTAHRYPGNSVTITVTRGSRTEDYSVSNLKMNGVDISGTIVNVTVVDVEVTIA